MGTQVKRIAISGYYGFNNSGDEAVLQSILLALKSQGEQAGVQFVPVVLSVNPEETRSVYGVEAVHRMKLKEVWSALRESDGLISGGGSLLQDETSAKTIPYYLAVIQMAHLLHKPVFIYSQGLGPVHRKMFYSWIKHSFARSAYISVRDEESAALLTRAGLRSSVHVVPDPVMGMPLRGGDELPTQNEADSPNDVTGVSVRWWNKDRSELHALAAALRTLLDQTETTLRFLPFHLPSDEEASLYVMEQLGQTYLHRVTMASGVTHPQDMLAEVSSCRLLIGMRLHSLIYAAGQFVPMAGISYDPKIDQFLARLSMKASMSTKAPDSEALAKEVLRLYHGAPEWRESKRTQINLLKSEAQQPAAQIARYYIKGRDGS